MTMISTRFKFLLPFIIAAVALITLTIGCKGRSELPTEENDTTAITTADTLDPDGTTEIVEVVPTKKADELFDDFLFAFMKNRHFQKQRIEFPLTYREDNNTATIERKDWENDPMFSKYEVFTLIFDNAKGEKLAKDTTLTHVVVEELNLDTQRTKCYTFNRTNGEWKLADISAQPMSESENSEFFNFYHKFATDAEFRQHHICDQVQFSTFDDDTFETIEGVIAASQFDEFAPELPTTKVTDIRYGQDHANTNTRILSIRALAGGMESNLQFKKLDNEWMLTRLDN